MNKINKISLQGHPEEALKPEFPEGVQLLDWHLRAFWQNGGVLTGSLAGMPTGMPQRDAGPMENSRGHTPGLSLLPASWPTDCKLA